jgi:hypothetical protein
MRTDDHVSKVDPVVRRTIHRSGCAMRPGVPDRIRGVITSQPVRE